MLLCTKMIRIDKDGYIIFGEDICVENELVNGYVGEYISTPLPIDKNGKQMPLYNPKWDGEQWIESATQEEIDEMTKVEPSPPTDTEILGQQMTEREIEAMIQGQQLSDMEIRLLTLDVK